MTKRWLGALAAFSMVSVSACSSSSSTVVAKPDTGGGNDASPDVIVVNDAPPGDETAPTGDAMPEATGETGPAPTNNTTGLPCVAPTKAGDPNTCDPIVPNGAICDTSTPNPTCLQLKCDLPDPTKISQCDNNKGVCVATGVATTPTICVGACTFSGDATPAVGCAAGNSCSAYGWAPPTATTPLNGIGVCQGTCAIDSDCKAPGHVCQTENGACVKKKTVFTKNLGDACTFKSPQECNCRAPASGAGKDKGVCTVACVVGGAACATGFQCTAGLSKLDKDGVTVLFTAEPAGLQGSCLRTCAADTDCAAYNSVCKKTYVGPASTGVCEPAFGP